MTNNMLNKILKKLLIFILFLSVPLSVSAIEPLDTLYPEQEYLRKIYANKAWDITREASDVIIAVIDTGVDIDNPDLKNNIWVNKDEIPDNGLDDDRNGYIDDVYGWDFVNDTPNVKPDITGDYSKIAVNHGTIVAGIIAAEGGNDIGVSGVAWRAKIMPLKVLGENGEGNTISVTRAINYARENGADILNLSFIGEFSSKSLSFAIENAYKSGILIVAASGNEVSIGEDLDIKPAYPVCQDGPKGENWVLGVSAVDLNDKLTSFANYGSKCIDIVAPGVRVVSTQYYDKNIDAFKYPYGGYWYGTSVAAPQVAGAAALIKATNPSLGLSDIRSILLNNTDDIYNINFEKQGKLGYGRLNVFKSVLAAQKLSPKFYKVKNEFIVTGAGPGGGPHVKMYDASSNLRLQFFAFESDFTGGVYVDSGDIDGDGSIDIVASPFSSRVPEVRIFNRWGVLVNSFRAYNDNFQKGFKIVLADVDRDGKQEIITAPNAGGGPHIRIFNKEGKLLKEFFAFNSMFRGGLDVAVYDIDLDKEMEIIVVPKSNSLPVVKIFDTDGNLERQFFAFEPDYLGGMFVGGYKNKIIVGTGTGRSTTIKVFDRFGNFKTKWDVYTPYYKNGVKVDVNDINGDGLPEIITAPDKTGGPHIKIYNINGFLLKEWMAYNPAFRGGVNIGSGF